MVFTIIIMMIVLFIGFLAKRAVLDIMEWVSPWGLDNSQEWDAPHMLPIIITIIITRPKPAYGRQGLTGSWGQDGDEVRTFLVFLTSHFAAVALSLDLNQPWTIDDNKNPLEIMKTDLDP